MARLSVERLGSRVWCDLARETLGVWHPRARQALMLLAHLRKGETYRDLAGGFDVGVTTAYRYLREGLQVLAALAPRSSRRCRSLRARHTWSWTARCYASTG